MNRIIWFFIGLVFLGLFAFFSKYVKQGGLKNTDFAVTVKIQDKIDKSSRLRTARLVGEIMEGSTFFASPEASIAAILVITGIAFFDRVKKRVRPLSFFIPIAFLLLVLAEIYGKSVVHHPAPPFFMIKNPTTIFPKYYINEEFSYPSGHAARSMFIALTFLSLISNRLSPSKKAYLRLIIIMGILLIYVGLVSISRIYLGYHWLSDVAGGWILGLVFASFASLFI